MHSVTVKNAQVRKLDDLMKTRAVPVRYRTKALHVRASALAEQSPAAASASSGAAPRGYKDAIMLQCAQLSLLTRLWSVCDSCSIPHATLF